MDNTNNRQIQNNGGDGENEKTLSIRDLVFLVLNNWWWFVISVVVCLIIAGFYYKSQPKTWTASGTILVRDEGNNVRYQSRNMDQILSNMGMDNTNLSLENEIYMLKSSWLMNQVVNRLGLNHTCSRNDMFKKISYFKDAPLALTLHDGEQANRDVKFNIRVKPLANNKYEYRAEKYGKKSETLEAYYSQPVKFDDTLSFTIEKTEFYTNEFENVNLQMGISPSMSMARSMLKSLNIARVDKMASIISITYNDSNRERANQIVDTLIAVYNDDALEDKNKVAQKTESFISERIALISGELDVVDAQVENIKRTSGLGEMTGANTQLLQTGQRLSEQVVALETEMTLISYIKNYVSDPVNKEELIPVNVGISDV
ncbi:MAG: Wzz/FepE/Etk N-terminal domain-containing protein, partial [Bacteroidales bacterium]|nr:Wzz/FepE/Etk N-terminal domain-containing protein [Bacteroidales bacterium]